MTDPLLPNAAEFSWQDASRPILLTPVATIHCAASTHPETSFGG